VWDALSFPVRFIMPAHYTILCFSKGLPRPLPGLTGEAGMTESTTAPDTFKSLEPLAEGFCLRSRSVKKRDAMHIDDRAADTVWPPLGDVCGSPTPPPGRRWCGRVSGCGGRLARSCPAASWQREAGSYPHRPADSARAPLRAHTCACAVDAGISALHSSGVLPSAPPKRPTKRCRCSSRAFSTRARMSASGSPSRSSASLPFASLRRGHTPPAAPQRGCRSRIARGCALRSSKGPEMHLRWPPDHVRWAIDAISSQSLSSPFPVGGGNHRISACGHSPWAASMREVTSTTATCLAYLPA